MGLLDFFKKKKMVKDEIFGEMEYMTFKDPTENFYVGEVEFQGHTIGIDISADESGPTDEQKEFYKEIEQQYNEIKENSIVPFLRKELKDYNFKNFDAVFKIDGLTLERIRTYRTKWEITYHNEEMEHYFLISFEDMKLKGISFI